MTKLLDCTTRDCGHSNNWIYSDEYILALMSKLNKNNFNYYEIGYRNFYESKNKGKFYRCTPEILTNFYKNKGNLSLGIMVDTKRYNEKDFVGKINDNIDFIRIATHPETLNQAINIAENLYNKEYTVMLQIMEISNLQEEHYSILNNWENKNILETLYIADTYGVINPAELEVYYNKLSEYGYKKLSFHGHNQNGNAAINSLKAIELGAFSIDVVHEETGINGGNLFFENLVKMQQNSTLKIN